MDGTDLRVVVLAAGKGTRMKSEKAKVLHEVLFRPMINHVLDSLVGLRPAAVVVVTGHQHRAVEAALAGYQVEFVRQDEQLGTGHAVLCAREAVGRGGMVLILCGDTPLLRPATLLSMADAHRREGRCLTVMTTMLDDPTNYGRVISADGGGITGIVEEKDADDEQRRIREVNAGIYCVDGDFLFSALERVGTDNTQGEVYLTDIVAIAVADGRSVGKFVCGDPAEITGVNSRVELAAATKVMQGRRNRELMAAGVTMIDPDSVFVGPDVEVGRDTIIYPGCVLSGHTVVGSSCLLKPGLLLHDSVLADGVTAGPYQEIINGNLA